MKQWTKEMEINVPIEKLWQLFDGSLENMQKIMPQVVANKPIKVTDAGVGSIYLQKYKEGKRIMEYEVETVEYAKEPHFKKLKVAFTLANMFAITAKYELEKINDTRTRFTYTVTNSPLKWYVKLLLMFASDKVVVEFVERVKKGAEKEA